MNHPGDENVKNGEQVGPQGGGRRTHFFDLGNLLAPSWGHLAPQVAPRPSKKRRRVIDLECEGEGDFIVKKEEEQEGCAGGEAGIIGSLNCLRLKSP